MPGKWRSENSPWVREVMEAFADNRVRDISILCSAQSSKTQTLICLMLWLISEDPGPLLWVMAAKDEVETFVRNRIKPAIEECHPVESVLTDDINAIKLGEINFATMTALFRGAGSPSKLQSTPIRWLILDEVRNYGKGALDTVLKRTRAFWNTRRAVVSTPANKDDAVDRLYKQGDQRVWHVPCPKCKQLAPLKFENLKWETSAKTRKDGVYDFDALAKTIRYKFPCCGHEIQDKPKDRKALGRNGKFVRTNPKAPKHRVSFNWNALLPHWVPWRDLVEEFINARAAIRAGDIEPMKTFITESLGESWEERHGEIEDAGELTNRQGDFDFNEAWGEEVVRFMGADRQAKGGEHYWWVIRAFGAFAQSRLIAYGRCNTKQELEEIRERYQVKPSNAILDTGYKATECYRFCAHFGWKAFKGDKADYFLYHDKKRKKTIRRIYQKTQADPSLGMRKRVRPIPLFRWSGNMARDLLSEFTSGILGDWQLPRRVGRDYLRQLTAHKRDEIKDSRGRISHQWIQTRRDDHLQDCELQILVGAIVSRTITLKDHDGEAD